MALGWQLGLAQHSLNTNALRFDNQYVEGNGFDGSIAHGEQLGQANVQVADIGLGAQVIHHFEEERGIESIKLGFGLGHASQPSFSFLNTNTYLPRRYSLMAEVATRPHSGTWWSGRYLWMKQGDALQHHAQLMIQHELDPNFSVAAAVGYRLGDALVPMVQVAIDDWQVGLSYDVTISGLRNTNLAKGGLELQANWQFGKKKKKPLHPDPVAQTAIVHQAPDTVVRIVDRPVPEQPSVCKCEEQLKQQAPELPVPSVVYFDTDKSLIKNRYRESLDELAVSLITRPEIRIQISGHTDMEGSNGYNFQLGMARAQAVKEFLMERGVSSSRITTFSFGESQPAADNHSPEGRSLNRRAAVLLYF
ncbi:MAG: OmpA family protein [Bacteroidia bacterium]